jgi:hypothetical protein
MGLVPGWGGGVGLDTGADLLEHQQLTPSFLSLCLPLLAALHCNAMAVNNTGTLNDPVHCCHQIQEKQIQIVQTLKAYCSSSHFRFMGVTFMKIKNLTLLKYCT